MYASQTTKTVLLSTFKIAVGIWGKTEIKFLKLFDQKLPENKWNLIFSTEKKNIKNLILILLQYWKIFKNWKLKTEIKMLQIHRILISNSVSIQIRKIICRNIIYKRKLDIIIKNTMTIIMNYNYNCNYNEL